MSKERPNLDDELQSADDGLVEDAAILQEIKEEQLDVSVADPVQVDLSEIAADTARELRDDARRQRLYGLRSSSRTGEDAAPDTRGDPPGPELLVEAP